MADTALAQLLASFVPKLIQKRSVRDASPIASPVSEEFDAVVLFADISGFTALTEKLAKRGPVGVEALAGILNDYFGRLIDIIHDYGGDVVKFAGDAIIAIWPLGSAGTADPASEEPYRQFCLRAAECALEVRTNLLDYRTEESTLYLKLALSAGQITQTHVGGIFNRWEFALTGLPLVELGVANNLTKAGDILLSPSALALIGADCDFKPLEFEVDGSVKKAGRLKRLKSASQLPAGRERIEIPESAQAALSPYIPGSIINRVLAGQSEWLAELRRITVVFINLYDPSQITSLEMAQNLMRLIQRVTYRFEGSVNKISQDDKGIMMDTAFGLPPLAHEDDPSRGVQAAMMIRAELHALGIRSSIGVTTGRVFCGLLGNNDRRVYTFLGNSVNLAARLMALGASQTDMIEREGIAVLCDRATYDASRDQVEFETLPPQRIKGRDELVEVFHPLHGKSGTVRRQTQLIGREEEKNILVGALLELQRGSPLQTVVLHGEAGIGKSQLAEELIRQAQVSEITVFTGEADAIEKNNPYYAWKPVFNKVFGIEEILRKPQLSSEDRASMREIVLGKLGQMDPGLLRYAPLLTVLLPVSIPENDFTSSLTGETRGGNIRELLVKILQFEARRSRVLVVVEDIHWLDSASWTLLLDMYQQVRPLMLLVTTRPFERVLPQEFKQIADRPDTHFVKLEAMPLDDVEALVCQRLGVHSMPAAVGRLIREKSEGNPFFAEELAYALRDSGVLVIEREQARLASGSDMLENITLPDTLQAAITSRIDGLNPSQQLVLKVASVIGRIFAYRTLEAIHPIESDKPEMRAYMDSLTRLSLTLVESETPDLAYIFKHAVTQETAYNLMLFAQRRQLHQAVGEWLEAHHQQDIESFYTLLAYHWTQAARVPDPENHELCISKAREYLEKAGDQSLKNFANAEALDFFKELLGFVDVNKAARLYLGGLYRKMGEACLGLGRIMEAKEYILKAMETFGLPLPPSDPGRVAAILKHVLIQAGHRLWPKRFTGRKFDPSEQASRWEIVTLCQKLSSVQFLNGDPNPLPMLFANIAGLNVAETLMDFPGVWTTYAYISATAGLIPLRSQARYYKERWFALREKFDDPNLFIDGVVALCTVESGNGEWQLVKDLIEKTSALCEEMGDHRRNGDAVAYLAVNTLFEGGPKLAEPYNKREWEIAMRRENPIHIGFAYQVDCSALVWQGRYDECIANAQKCLTFSEKNWVGEVPEYIVRSAMYLAMWLKGEREEAWQPVKAALDRFAKASVVDFSTHLINLHLAEVAFLALEDARKNNLSKAQIEEIEKYAKIALKNLKKFTGVFAIGGPALNRFLGSLEWYTGEHEKAFQYWRTSAEKAHFLPMKYEEARAWLETGRHLDHGSPERTPALKRAAELFTECGLDNWVSVVEIEL
jgi:class 3 adenylate cyclase/tetratricopeptide (TPR) repeat protein